MNALHLPSGLLQAAAEGHRDAYLDLAYALKDMGDPRGADLLWLILGHTTNWTVPSKEEYRKACLYATTCPVCGSPITVKREDIDCPYLMTRYDPNTQEYVITSVSCGWTGKRGELVPPLISKE